LGHLFSTTVLTSHRHTITRHNKEMRSAVPVALAAAFALAVATIVVQVGGRRRHCIKDFLEAAQDPL
jgi:hypothetical protein